MNIILQLRRIVAWRTKFQFLEIKSQQSTSVSERFAYREKYNIALGKRDQRPRNARDRNVTEVGCVMFCSFDHKNQLRVLEIAMQLYLKHTRQNY